MNGDTDNHPFFSVVIPAKNEEKLLQHCLESLRNQSTKRRYEIVVIDGNSSDTTRSIARSYGARVVMQKHPGKSFAFSESLPAVRGEILCYTEADCEVPHTWLSSIDRLLSDRRFGAVTGVYRFTRTGKFLRVAGSIIQPVSDHIARVLFGFYPLRSTNFAVRRDVLAAVGGFNPAYADLYDFELSRRIAGKYRIRYDNTLCVHTSDRRFHGRIFTYIKEFSATFIRVCILDKPTDPQYADIR